jgi:hypothetical protein
MKKRGRRNKGRQKENKRGRKGTHKFLHKPRDAERENVIFISHFFVTPSHSKNKLNHQAAVTKMLRFSAVACNSQNKKRHFPKLVSTGWYPQRRRGMFPYRFETIL